MICKKCGTEVSDTLKFCPNCGNSLAEEANSINNAVENVQSSPVPNTDVQKNIFENVQVESKPVEPNIQTNSGNISVEQPSSTSTIVPPTQFGFGQVQNNQPTVGIPEPVQSVQPISQPTNNFGQQPNTFAQPMYPNQQYTPQTTKKNTGLIAVIVGIVVAAIVCIAIIASSGDKKNSSSNSNSSSNVTPTSNVVSNSNVTSNTTSNVVSNSNVTSNTTSNVTSNTVTFKGFVLQIPSAYTVSSSTSQLQLIGTNNRDIAVINIQDGNYDTIKASSSTIQTYMKNAGYDVANIKTGVYGGVEFITAEVEQSGKKMILAYSKLSSNKIFMVVCANTSYTVDYSPLTYFGTMVSTAKAA